jgi:hypothetical protein
MLAPLVSQQQGTVQHRRCLTVAGLEVYGYSPISTWQLNEAAYGQVSDFTFTLEDPGAVLSPRIGDPVVLWDTQADVPEFAGWVVTLDYAQMAPGRRIAVRCAGAEALLDWMQVPAMTFDGSPSYSVAQIVQSLIAAGSLSAQSPLRAMADGVTFSTGSQAFPTSWYSMINAGSYATPAGSLRQALQSLWTQTLAVQAALADGPPLALMLSVDFWHGVRLWAQGDWKYGATVLPSDFPTLAVAQDTSAGVVAESPAYTVDGGSSVRGAYVTGANAAGTGFVTGTPVMGPTATISDPNATSAASRDAIGLAATYGGAAVRGSFRLLDAEAQVHPGYAVQFGVGAVLPSTLSYRVGTVSRTFNPSGRCDYTVSFGGAAPSYAYAKGRPTYAR